MEENLRPVTSSANPDLAEKEAIINELTPWNSVDTSRRNSNAGKGVWTNAKHNLYLNRLEASFIDQLNRSMGLLMWRSERKPRDQQNSSKELPANTGTTSDQYTVLRNGCWQKINFEKNQSLLKTISNSHSFLESPWARYFRGKGKVRATRSDDCQEKHSLPGEELHSVGKRTFYQEVAVNMDMINHQILQDSCSSLAEVSDQNFVDGDGNKKSSDFSIAKRLKRTVEDSSSRDQVVPSGKFDVSQLSTLGIISPGTGEQVCREWSLEDAEIVSEEQDVKPFLRES